MKNPEYLNRNWDRIEKESRKFFARLKRRPPKGIDDKVKELDRQVFSKINCLDCANCCKTISPVFKQRDIVRLANHFNMRQADFAEQFLYMDADGDYVLKTVPCPFLQNNNECSIYDIRPFACRSYPHTGTLPVTKSWELIIKNSSVCPAVNDITRLLQEKYK